jgi:predicted site-specific integrase-resolvase
MYKIGEFAKKVGVTVYTVREWDKDGRLPARKTHTGHRYYTDEDVDKVLGISRADAKGKVVVYSRVSSQAQRPDLVNQRHILEQFCAGRGLTVDEWVDEIGGGLNFKRKQFLRIVDEVAAGKISILVIAHKDRLARFGFELIEHLCEVAGCQLLVMNTESLSPEQEMVQDLMTIIHCFSSRLYGLRNYKKTLAKALGNVTSTPDSTESNA